MNNRTKNLLLRWVLLDGETTLRSLVNDICQADKDGRINVAAMLRELATETENLGNAAYTLSSHIDDLSCEFQDRYENTETHALKHGLGKPIVEHTRRRHITRDKWMDKLNSPEVIERTAQEYTAKRMVDEAMGGDDE